MARGFPPVSGAVQEIRHSLSQWLLKAYTAKGAPFLVSFADNVGLAISDPDHVGVATYMPKLKARPMQISIQLRPDQMGHVTNHQIGAFVAYCYTLKNISWVKVYRAADMAQPFVEAAFDLPGFEALADAGKIASQLSEAFKVYSTMEPFPCPCGCGAYISVSPCLRQAEILTDKPQLNASEMALARNGNKITAIKELRQRFAKYDSNGMTLPGSLGLKDAKDLVDAYLVQISVQQNRPF